MSEQLVLGSPTREKLCARCDGARDGKHKSWCKACRKLPPVGARELVCNECGGSFASRAPRRSGERTFCSLVCQKLCRDREKRRKYPRKPAHKPCPVCDAVFQDASRSNTRKYCSDRCKHLAKRVKHYGGTIKDMRRLYAHADVCAACDGEFYRDDGWGRVMEHCHDTKRIRGITHQKCNTGLGCADHDLEKLHRWQVYLARHTFDLVDLCHAA